MDMLELLSDEEVIKEYTLSKLIRYNHRCRNKEESVAEHSFFVSIFCLKIMAKLNLSERTKIEVLTKAALHDVPELKTSDIPHDVKSRYPDMAKMLDKIEYDYYKQNWSEYSDLVLNTSPLAEKIVKLADAYSVLQFCINEQNLGNNSVDIFDILTEVKERIKNHTKAINDMVREGAN